MARNVLEQPQYIQYFPWRRAATSRPPSTFVTTAPNDEQGYALLLGLGMPFRNKEAASVAQAG